MSLSNNICSARLTRSRRALRFVCDRKYCTTSILTARGLTGLVTVNAICAVMTLTLANLPNALTVAADPTARLAGATSATEELFQYVAPTGMDAEATQIVEELAGTDQAFRAGLQKLQASKLPDGGRLAAASVKLRQMRRMRERLNALHEPAAVDLTLRIEVYNRTLVALSERFWGLPQSAPVRARVLQGLGKTHPKRLQELQRIAELVQDNRPEEAEAKLDRLLDDTFATAGCLNPKEAEPINQAIGPVQSMVSSSMQQLRSQRIAQTIADNLQQQMASYEAMVQQVEQAASSGTAAEGLLPEIIPQWSAQHTALLKAVYANATVSTNSNLHSNSSSAVSSSVADDSPSGQLAARMKQAVLQLLRAVAANIPDSSAKEFYPQFTRTAGEFTALVDDTQWTKSLQAECDSLAKRAGLSAQVAAYTQATSDALRWRERFARAQAAELSKNGQSASAAARQQLLASDATLGVYFQQGPSVPTLRQALPQVKRAVQDKLIGQELHSTSGTLLGDSHTGIENGAEIDGMARSAISGWDENCRLTLTSPIDQSAGFTALLLELLIDPQHPPLSVATAQLLSGAQAMHFVAAGGQVLQLHIGAMDADVQGMTVQEASTLAPGEDLLPTPDIPSGSQLTLNFLVEPRWVQNRYFCSLMGSGIK